MGLRRSIRLAMGVAAGALALVGPTALAAPWGSGQASPVEAIYVDSNEGGASGGHSALRVGDYVYHFRALHSQGESRVSASATLRLHRQSWRSFRVHYNLLENRNLGGVELALSGSDADRVASHFAKLYAVQEQQLEVLRWLELEARLEAETTPSSVALPGAGLFSPEGAPDASSLEMRRRVEVEYGATFLQDAMVAANGEIASLPRKSAKLAAVALRRDRAPLPRLRPLAGERLENAMLWGFALRVLAEAHPLNDHWLRAPLAGAGRRLSPTERSLASALLRDLEASMLRLLRSRRPDRGGALLVTIARIHGLRRSLASGILQTLDAQAGVEHEASRAIDPTFSAKRERSLRSWHRLLRAAHARWRNHLAARSSWDEESLHAIEVIAARDAALEQGLAEGQLFWLSAERSLPLPLAEQNLSPANSRPETPETASANLSLYRRELEEMHRYSLIDRNCATELVRAWRGAFRTAEEADVALGGELRPGETASFIPFALDRAVRMRLRSRRTWNLPSHRQQRLVNLKGVQGDWRVALREGNTLTSTLYEPGPEDSSFLFFTDSSVWSRPLLGVFNVGYGLLQSGAGVLAVPFDGGRRLRGGLRGTFYALPELAFFNIRKGRYEWVEEVATLDLVP